MVKFKVLEITAIGDTIKAFLTSFIDALEQGDFDVTCCCSHGQASEELKLKGYKVTNIDILRSINIKAAIKSIIQLYKFIKNEKFDIVHVHTPIASILGRIAARLAGCKCIIYTVHGFYFHENMRPAVKKTIVLLEKVIARFFTNYMFTVNEEDRLFAINYRFIKENRIININSVGIDLYRFSPENQVYTEVSTLKTYYKLDNYIVLGFIGRIVEEKGILDFLRVVKNLSEKSIKVKALIIGGYDTTGRDIGIKDKINTYIRENNLTQNVIFAGQQNEIEKYIALMDLLVFPSYREGMPVSPLEAMSMEKPVVAYDIRGCREEIVSGENGYIVPLKDIDRLTHYVQLLVEDSKLRYKLGKQGRKTVIDKFSQERVIRTQIEVFESIRRNMYSMDR